MDLIEVPNGWKPSVVQMILDIRKINNNVQFMYIKEKFGTLRVGASDTSDDINNIIESTKKSCEKICQNCGNHNGQFLIDEIGLYAIKCIDCLPDHLKEKYDEPLTKGIATLHID